MPDPTNGLVLIAGAVVSIAVLVSFFLLVNHVGHIRNASERQVKATHIIMLSQLGQGIVGRSGMLQSRVRPNAVAQVLLDGLVWDCISDEDIREFRKVTVSGLAGGACVLKVSAAAAS
jgi:membrane protein implicated in regulation of membrane protease activity